MIRRALLACLLGSWAPAGRAADAPPAGNGPYNVTFLQGGVGLVRALPAGLSILHAGAAWSISSWLRIDVPQAGEVILAAIGERGTQRCTCLLLDSNRLSLHAAGNTVVQAEAPLRTGAWQAIAVTYDGRSAHLYVDGIERASAPLATDALSATLELAPVVGWPSSVRHFGGSLARFTLDDRMLSASTIAELAVSPPDFELTSFTAVGVGWPLQARAWTGLSVPQDPWTLPRARATASTPLASPVQSAPPLQSQDDGLWKLAAWRMRAAPGLADDGAALSSAGYDDAQWYAATVPGTVLTTLVDRGVYPDPDHGLNNLTIPESLARQDYWYRTEFTAPAQSYRHWTRLRFEGINYAAEVWLNGQRLGAMRGAFARGVFDVSHTLRPGRRNALAVRISPPPHPGIPSEQSIAFGPGENGGALALDGPTFIATEGWDWIPALRDRDAGLWQDVLLESSGPVRILDAAVTTQLPLPRLDQARLSIEVPLENDTSQSTAVELVASFDEVSLHKRLTVPPGNSEIRLTPEEFQQLVVEHPRLWWPNGYGAPELHALELRVLVNGAVSSSRRLRFGMRQLTYELSLFDHSGRLRRVEIDPTSGSARGERLVDVRHAAIKQVPGGWAASLTAAGEQSPAVHDLDTVSLAPYLVIRVNGVPIAARGGSWGMDDARKRCSRARLEPFFRLHREAHLNVIRNWLGQNTEEVFYELADENGMLVLNDFWESTQDFQLEAQDPALFLANARDVILRYRHHPSIAVWFGRNEGVPQPILNEGLADLVAALDGTRYYTGSSNRVNLQDSGPYSYRDPVGYFTDLARGFAVEIGTPSLATLESIQASIPAPDRWPLSDTIAYHDWHFGGNGDVAGFMRSLAAQFGAAASLEDFERKAQMMNYVDYRAVFEGFQAHLWTQNSGRLLWMTHPAWPSNHWQIYSSDYDTHASYYGVKKAAEPLHAQLNLPDYALVVVNTTREAREALHLTARVLSLGGTLLATREHRVDAPANQIVRLPPLELAPLLAREGVVLVSLVLSDAAGAPLSENLYWPGRDEAAMQALTALKPQPVRLQAQHSVDGAEELVRVTLENHGREPVLATKLTLVDAGGARILPAFYSDNYVSLLPGESHQVEIRYPSEPSRTAGINLRGWNVERASIPLD